MSMSYVALAKYPEGRLTEDCFAMRSHDIPALADGQLHVRVLMLSIDPYLRGILAARPMFGEVIQLGSAVPGRGLGEVLESRSLGIEAGELVVGEFGWQNHAVIAAQAVRSVPRLTHPLSWHLGVLGVPGITALLALQTIGSPKAGETVFISSAAGAVGSAAGQIAKSLGCITIGSTSESKIQVCKETFGFDHCINRSAPGGLATKLEELRADIDIALDNVGNEVLAAVLPRMRQAGRIILCGRIAEYNRVGAADTGTPSFEPVLFKQLRVQGFNVRAHAEKFDHAIGILRSLADRGELTQLDSRSHLLESAPNALCGLLEGRYVGKVIVEL